MESPKRMILGRTILQISPMTLLLPSLFYFLDFIFPLLTSHGLTCCYIKDCYLTLFFFLLSSLQQDKGIRTKRKIKKEARPGHSNQTKKPKEARQGHWSLSIYGILPSKRKPWKPQQEENWVARLDESGWLFLVFLYSVVDKSPAHMGFSYFFQQWVVFRLDETTCWYLDPNFLSNLLHLEQANVPVRPPQEALLPCESTPHLKVCTIFRLKS